TSTGEAPGTNRLEIVADRGRMVVESGRISFTRNEVPMNEFCATAPGRFTTPPVWNVEIPTEAGPGSHHAEILRNFADAILDGAALIAPGAEGIHSIELANAMLLSAFENRTIELPLDSAKYEECLQKKIAGSTFVKAEPNVSAVDDFSTSFAR
ncbi:MAG: gfo/Idh/MocA family oxidoreductase, partial [Verrucomicrobia bacterium]|nr:gfo/Idh/MocA family oxidoreductase [Verrucomicrobiota bacterium]